MSVCSVCLEIKHVFYSCDRPDIECEKTVCCDCVFESFYGFYCSGNCAWKDIEVVVKELEQDIRDLRHELNQKDAKPT